MGGEDTLYGVTYQVLCTLCAALEDTLKESIAQVIIEPKAGDAERAEVTVGGRRIVEQYKSRRSERPWSESEIVAEVLPDLLRAVPGQGKAADVVRFVTQGRRGRLKGFELLRQRSRDCPDSEMPADELTAADRKRFLHIVGKLGQGGDVSGQRRVWTLLSRLEMTFERSPESLHDKARIALRPYLDDLAKLDQVVNSICWKIQGLGGKGNQPVDMRALLLQHDLSPITFRDREAVGKRLGAVLDETLRNRGYQADHDIGRALVWSSESAPIRLIVGESGYGKTWASSVMAVNVRRQGQWVIWLPASGSAADTLRAVTTVLWSHGLNRPHPPDFRYALEDYRKFTGDRGAWLTVIVDGVELAESRGLLAEWPTSLGVNLVMTGSPALLAVLSPHTSTGVGVTEISRFSLTELSKYLGRRGLPWADIPADVRDILRTPILAKLYCDLGPSAWRPESEYDLLRRFWSRIVPEVHQGATMILASRILQGKTRYPVSLAETSKMPSEWLSAMQQNGWLRVSGATLTFCHDRLLNWAAAEAAVDLYYRGLLDDDKTRELIAAELRPEFGRRNRCLPYLPLDVLWIATRRGENVMAVTIMKTIAIHNSEYFRRRGLLPSIGRPLLVPLESWLLAADGAPDWRAIVDAVGAAAAIGRLEPEAVSHLVTRLLASENSQLQDAGLILAERCPAPGFLDRVWDLHQVRASKHHEKGGGISFDYSTSALAACAATNPEWLEIRLGWSEGDSLVQLVHCLANIGTAEAGRLWSMHSQSLIERVDQRHRRCLVRCIDIFRDESRLRTLETWLSVEDDHTADMAFIALADMAPLRLIDRFADLGDTIPYLWRHRWLRQFTFALGERGRALIATTMRAAVGRSHGWSTVFHGLENDMDRDSLDALLADTQALLARNDIDDERRRCRAITRHLDMLARVGHPDLLDAFTTLRGGAFETGLLALGERAITEGWPDRHQFFRHVFPVLLRIGGNGFSRLLCLALRDKTECGSALEWAGWCGDPSVADELSAIAAATGDDSEAGRCIRWYASRALEALDTAGEDERLLAGVLCNDQVVTHDLMYARRGTPPMCDRALAPVVSALAKEGANHARALLAAALSGRADLIPQVRMILANADPSSEEALFAVIALDALGDRSDEFLSLLRRMLWCGGRRPDCVSALLRLDTEAAREVLKGYLSTRGNSFDHVDIAIAEGLLPDPAAVALIQERVVGDRRRRRAVDYDTLVAAGVTTDQMLEDAGARRLAAIEALQCIDPIAAIDAAEALIVADGAAVDMHEAALLLDLDSQRAGQAFRQLFARPHALRAHEAITLALRLAPNLATDLVQEMLNAPEADLRRKAVLACGGQEPGFFEDRLQAVIIGDPDRGVRQAAHDALARQRQDHAVGRLLERLREVDGLDALRLGHALLGIGDVRAMVWLRHPRCVDPALRGKSPWLRKRLINWLQDARRKADEVLEREEREAINRLP
ncbi:MAG: hypothetical protein HQL41_10765 [Alphaproteobacteria bacterium]|nr:hypothetical protein [Alphaproteobacteria bacterium]